MTSSDDSGDEPSSPACALHQLNDAYLGYATADELNAALVAVLRNDPEAASTLTSLIPRLRDPVTRRALHDFMESGLTRMEILKALITAPRLD